VADLYNKRTLCSLRRNNWMFYLDMLFGWTTGLNGHNIRSCKRQVPSLTQENTIQINHQPDATIFQFIILTFVYSSTCFGRFPAHHQELNDCSGSFWFYLRIVVTVVLLLCSWSGRPTRPRTQHDCHHDTKETPEAATAVIELLVMSGKTPETCWAVNKRQDNK